MIKVLTVVGTRPEIIKLSRIIAKLEKNFEHTLVHTGQNYDYELNQIFFDELKINEPNFYLNAANGSASQTVGKILIEFEKICKKIKPDAILILGDTNSGLSAIVSKKLKIPIFHLEAGNRCFDERVPEEINRKIIDHISDINLPYTQRSCENLVSEGIKRKNIFIIGNPIYEVMNYYSEKIDRSKILKKLNLTPNNFIVCTLHREENIENLNNFKNYLFLIKKIAKTLNLKIVFPIHPRTKKKINKLKIKLSNQIYLTKPMGFIDFSCIEKNSKFIITDSGTVQEEASILNKLCLVFRDATERPETIENGDTLLINKDFQDLNKIKRALIKPISRNEIKEYKTPNVSNIVSNIINSDILV